ncbi:MAG TPA: BON domain-containing protein [Acidobacteriota bacterium]
MNKGMTLITATGLGAGLMYMFDPDRGKRRRAMIRDKVAHTFNQTGDAIGVTWRDLRNRTRGLVSEIVSLPKGDRIPDEVLEERVRSSMGRVVSHPGAVEVTAKSGRVQLRGPILASEVESLISCVSSLWGVTKVDNLLEAHEEADISALQGGSSRQGPHFDLLQNRWSPATRFLVGATGSVLALYGAKRRGVMGTAAGALGVGMLASGLTNGRG